MLTTSTLLYSCIHSLLRVRLAATSETVLEVGDELSAVFNDAREYMYATPAVAFVC